MHRASYRFMPPCGITETLSDVESVRVVHEDLMAEYENPIEHACSMELGQTFVCNGWEKPEGFCDSAGETVSPFVMTLAHGGEKFYDGWMKNPKSAMISCNDGFRLVSFLIETMDED